MAPELIVISISAVLAGSVFGDHCSPISDTTILSSTGAGCNHMDHVSSQIPYALVVAGVTKNVWLRVGVSIAMMLLIVAVLHRLAIKKEVADERVRQN